LQYVIKYILK